jgi:hypothetical protein
MFFSRGGVTPELAGAAILDGRIRYPISEKRIRVLCKMALQMVK